MGLQCGVQRVGLERMLVSKGFTSECFQTKSISEIFNFLIAIDGQVRGWRPKPNFCDLCVICPCLAIRSRLSVAAPQSK